MNKPQNKQQSSQILSVDDDPDTLALIALLLIKQGYKVRTANNGHTALEILHKGFRPDLILLDIDMPLMNGYEFCQQLQADSTLSMIPVIFLTVKKNDADRLKALAVGGVDFLTKPVSQNRLYNTIKAHLDTQEQWMQTLISLEQPSGVETHTAPSELAQAPQPTSSNNNSMIVSSGLIRFKEFLFSQFALPVEQWDVFANVPYQELYTQAVALGLSTRQLAQTLAGFLHMGFRPEIQPATVVLGRLPTPFCKKNMTIPIHENGQDAFIISNPFNIELMDTLKRFKNHPIYLTDPDNIEVIFGGVPQSSSALPTKRKRDIAEIVNELQPKYQTPAAQIETEIENIELSDEAPIIRLTNKVIEDACLLGASDIHIEPGEYEVMIRYRIDGDLRIMHRLKPAKLIQPLVSRLKIMSNLDIAERRLPQDGRIVFKAFSRQKLDFDLRVATTPMNFGEKVVMRIIDKQKTTLPLEKLGFSPQNIKLYREKIKTPYGMILHVGPTGSGKSMTLYSALYELQRPEINIQTAEDPIEYTLPGINQLQVQKDIGLTFASALRAFLRQDPDIILVGEIRDRETAHIAVEAALTGHLLLSTLHTNDAASTITRFIEMGIEPFMVSSSIVLVCAQRLLRTLCSQCKQAYSASVEEKTLLGVAPESPLTLYHPTGCLACNQVGYKGRIGIHEILVPDDQIRQIINKPGVTSEELKYIAVKNGGMITLYWDAVAKAIKGDTSIEEILARVRPDEFDSRPCFL